MPRGEFYIAYVDRAPEVTFEDVQAKIKLSTDWYRINARLWVLYTTSDAEKWHRRLHPLVGDDGSLFICKLDMSDRQGWMTGEFWNWIREHE